MKSLQDVIAELQAVEKDELDTVVAALEAAITDLQAIAGEVPAVPTITSVTVAFSDSTSAQFGPAVQSA